MQQSSFKEVGLVECVECPECLFIFDKRHWDTTDGKEVQYTCPGCEYSDSTPKTDDD